MKNRGLFPLTIGGYALIFLLVLGSLFIAVSWVAYDSIEQARNDIQQRNQDAARAELKESVNTLLETIEQLAIKVSAWDEIFQQIDNPAYYSYWREHRLLHTDVLPRNLLQAEVYDANGEVLAALIGSSFPPRIDISNLPPQVEVSAGDSVLIYYLPLKRDVYGADAAQGYLGMRLPLIGSLRQFYGFNSLEPQSISLPKSLHGVLAVDAILERIQYQVVSSPEVAAMMSIVQASVIQLAGIIAVLCLLFYLLLVFLLGRPLQRISDYIDQLRQGTPGKMLPGFNALFPVAELEKVRDSLNQYRAELQQAHNDLDEKNQELWKLAHHDSLTGVRNRRAFERELQQSREFLHNKRISIGLILFDLNHFKAINDTYGHQVGDEVLVAVSECIQESLRRGEKLFRIGGDEFATLIIGSATGDEMAVAQRCIDAVNHYDFARLGIREALRISCGLAHCDADDKERLDQLLWQADVAVYRAKRPGVVHPVLFSDDMAEGTEALFSSGINNAIYNAVTQGSGVEMHYQPLIATRNRRVVYHEALLRMRQNGSLIPPSSIFPLISQRHMEIELDQTVIRQVQRDLKSGLIPDHEGVSINLSAESLVHPELVDWLKPLTALLRRHPIILEVTETSLITQLAAATENLQRLRGHGFKVALDDFGSGYSSLRYLTSMPVDTIKFDISLIQGMDEPRLRQLVEELARMLSDMGYDLVAEGIENEALLVKVTAAGFSYAQGYLLGRPTRLQRADASAKLA